MNNFFTIVTGVTVGNVLSITISLYINSVLERRVSTKRKAELDKLFAQLNDDIKVKPIKKAASAKRTKKD